MIKTTILFFASLALMAKTCATKETNKEENVATIDTAGPNANTTEKQEPINDTATVVAPITTNPGNHTSENSVDWNGNYKGVVPCDDCSGINLNLTLNNDKTYKISYRYNAGGSNNTDLKTASGKFAFDKTGQIITLDGLKTSSDFFNKFFVGENVLWMLNAANEKVGARAYNSFVLTKQ